jgi:hypothetical protein
MLPCYRHRRGFASECDFSSTPKADIRFQHNICRDGPKAGVSRCSKNPLSKASLFDHLGGDSLGAAVAQTRLRLFEDAEQLITAWNGRHAAIAAALGSYE